MYNLNNPDIDINCGFIVTLQVLMSLWNVHMLLGNYSMYMCLLK